MTEQRSRAQERRAELALTAQGGAAVVAELEAPVREHPVREERWRLLALALYDAGRQGDALAALRRAREVLTDELSLNAESGRSVCAVVLAGAPHGAGMTRLPSSRVSRNTRQSSNAEGVSVSGLAPDGRVFGREIPAEVDGSVAIGRRVLPRAKLRMWRPVRHGWTRTSV